MKILYDYSLITLFVAAGIVFVLLFFISAPYGKFMRAGWGPSVRAKWAWMIMEAPSPVFMLIFFVLTPVITIPRVIFILLWLSHYVYRSFIYPFFQSGSNKSYPILLVAMAILFNSLNGFVNGSRAFYYAEYENCWITSWQFLSGLVIFISGFIINKTADVKLRRLRETSRDEYVIPDGWLFNYISCPHYFGEIIEWGGWALMTWSLPGLAFFVFTFANLFPRAVTSHSWYRKKFPDYPSSRKAVIPFII